MSSSCPFAALWSSERSPAAAPRITEASQASSDALQSTGSKFSRAISTPYLSSPTDVTSPASVPSSSSQNHQLAQGQQQAPLSADVSSQRLTRRQLRRLGKSWSLHEVRQHARKDDAWIAVDGKVYDITEHLVNHPGWNDTSAISTVLSILAHAGTDCSQEFRDIHRPYPVAWRQLQAYYIGELAAAEPQGQVQSGAAASSS